MCGFGFFSRLVIQMYEVLHPSHSQEEHYQFCAQQQRLANSAKISETNQEVK